MRQHIALRAIIRERKRQDAIHPPMMFHHQALAILVEEVGEVAQALLEGGDIQTELIQVAAVAVRWLENLVPGPERTTDIPRLHLEMDTPRREQEAADA